MGYDSSGGIKFYFAFVRRAAIAWFLVIMTITVRFTSLSTGKSPSGIICERWSVISSELKQAVYKSSIWPFYNVALDDGFVAEWNNDWVFVFAAENGNRIIHASCCSRLFVFCSSCEYWNDMKTNNVFFYFLFWWIVEICIPKHCIVCVNFE